MASTASSTPLKLALLPSLAILRHELRSLWGSWLVRLWLIASAIWSLLVLSGSWAVVSDSLLVGWLMFPYLVFPWFFVVIVLGVTPVTGGRAEALADGILSRPITRWEYLLASWAARVITVVGSFLAVIVPCVLLAVLAKRPPADDGITAYGIVTAMFLVALVMAFLVSMGFFLGTLLRGAVLAMVVLVFVWYPINLVLNAFDLEEFSPISLNRAMPTLLRTTWRTEGGPGSQTASAEDMEAVAQQAAAFLNVLSGQAPPPPPPRDDQFFDRQERFREFSLARVLLGYSIPTLLSFGLAALVFGRRDL